MNSIVGKDCIKPESVTYLLEESDKRSVVAIHHIAYRSSILNFAFAFWLDDNETGNLNDF